MLNKPRHTYFRLHSEIFFHSKQFLNVKSNKVAESCPASPQPLNSKNILYAKNMKTTESLYKNERTIMAHSHYTGPGMMGLQRVSQSRRSAAGTTLRDHSLFTAKGLFFHSAGNGQ